MESMASALWALYDSQKAKGLVPAMRQTLFKLEKLESKEPRWFNAMGELAILEKNYQQAIRFFGLALNLKQKPEYLLNLANAHYFAEDFRGASRILEGYLEAHPGDAHARINLANCRLRLEDYEGAEALSREGLENGAEPAPFWNALGQAAFHRGRLEEALSWYDQAYAAAPDWVEALFNRSNTLLRLGRVEEALAGFAQCVRKDEAFEPAWQNRATACLEAGQPVDALRSVEKALQLNPNGAENHYLLARIRLETKELKLAREALKRALRLESEHVPSLLAMARVCLLEEEKEEACSWAKRVLTRTSAHPGEETVAAVSLLVQVGEYEACLQAIARLRFQGGLGKVGLFKAICLWKTRKIKEAIELLESLLKAEGGGTAEAFTLLGMMLAETGASALSESRFRAALEQQPGAAQASQQLARLLAGQGKEGEALDVLQAALERNPGHPDLLYNLACCQARAGNFDDAWASLRSAVERGFDDVACLLDDPDLKTLRELKEFAPLFE